MRGESGRKPSLWPFLAASIATSFAALIWTPAPAPPTSPATGARRTTRSSRSNSRAPRSPSCRERARESTKAPSSEVPSSWLPTIHLSQTLLADALAGRNRPRGRVPHAPVRPVAMHVDRRECDFRTLRLLRRQRRQRRRLRLPVRGRDLLRVRRRSIHLHVSGRLHFCEHPSQCISGGTCSAGACEGGVETASCIDMTAAGFAPRTSSRMNRSSYRRTRSSRTAGILRCTAFRGRMWRPQVLSIPPPVRWQSMEPPSGLLRRPVPARGNARRRRQKLQRDGLVRSSTLGLYRNRVPRPTGTALRGQQPGALRRLPGGLVPDLQRRSARLRAGAGRHALPFERSVHEGCDLRGGRVRGHDRGSVPRLHGLRRRRWLHRRSAQQLPRRGRARIDVAGAQARRPRVAKLAALGWKDGGAIRSYDLGRPDLYSEVAFCLFDESTPVPTLLYAGIVNDH